MEFWTTNEFGVVWLHICRYAPVFCIPPVVIEVKIKFGIVKFVKVPFVTFKEDVVRLDMLAFVSVLLTEMRFVDFKFAHVKF